jgi:membrane-associated phospholipid phosphatase
MRTEPSLASPAVRPGPGLRLAQGVSYVVNPIVLPPLTFALTLAHFLAPPREFLLLTATAVLFFCLVPLAYVISMVRRGQARSLEVRDRRARFRPMIVTIVSGLAGFGAFFLASETGRPFLLLAAGTYVLNVALSLLVTRWWKISIHLIALAGFLASGLFIAEILWPWPVGSVFSTSWLYPALLLIPLLMWARVRSGAHTPAQVLAGALGGFLVTTMELAVMTPIVMSRYGV